MMLLNADVGEGLETDAVLIPLLDQASIACGGHTGDQRSMAQAIARCQQHQVQIGAHPSYPDRQNFGRKSLSISSSNLQKALLDQIDQLWQVCRQFDATIEYVKPHGALYNDMVKDLDLAETVCTVVQAVSERFNHPVSLMVSSKLNSADFVDIALKHGVSLQFEAFLDRAYAPSGDLVSRQETGAVYGNTDQILQQTRGLVFDQLVSTSNGDLSLPADSLCLHGDNHASVAAATEVRQLLDDVE
jgi:UPF0271 protein